MKKRLLITLLILGFLSVFVSQAAFADNDDSSASDTSGSSSTTPGAPDEVVSRGINSVKNDIVFDSADAAAPVFSKSDETFRVPAATKPAVPTK